ncbi:hypothetical protein KC19_9G001900, partial [Ceratodon purpureus]
TTSHKQIGEAAKQRSGEGGTRADPGNPMARASSHEGVLQRPRPAEAVTNGHRKLRIPPQTAPPYLRRPVRPPYEYPAIHGKPNVSAHRNHPMPPKIIQKI